MCYVFLSGWCGMGCILYCILCIVVFVYHSMHFILVGILYCLYGMVCIVLYGPHCILLFCILYCVVVCTVFCIVWIDVIIW